MNDVDLLRKISEYQRDVPGIEAIPKAAISAITWFASHEAQMIPVLRSGKVHADDYASILPSIHSKDVFEHLNKAATDTQEFLTCFVAICHGYFATQFCVRGHFAPIHVELLALKNALLEAREDQVSAYAVGGNLDIASRAAIRSIENSKTIYSQFANSGANWFDVLIARCVLMGALTWHLVDNISSSAAANKPIRARVFLSYSRSDKKRALTFQKNLEQHGIGVWRDEKEIHVGSSVIGRIATGIAKESDFMVLLMSRTSLSSNWVEHEVAQALTREHANDGTYLLPVRLDDSEIPLHLNIKKYADARRSTRAAVNEILSAMKWHDTYMG
jgi:TIR domain